MKPRNVFPSCGSTMKCTGRESIKLGVVFIKYACPDCKFMLNKMKTIAIKNYELR